MADFAVYCLQSQSCPKRWLFSQTVYCTVHVKLLTAYSAHNRGGPIWLLMKHVVEPCLVLVIFAANDYKYYSYLLTFSVIPSIFLYYAF